MNGLDLFSGIGGLSLALAPWISTVAYCENDCYAQAVLLSRMSGGLLGRAPIWDDVRTLSAKHFNVPIDIVFGGFPCQDISVAGHGKGVEGERSGLVFELLRLCEELRPAFIFLENVPAIRIRGAEQVGKSLAALGYDCRWDIVSAMEVGASHRRERWFLLAHSNRETLRIEQGWREWQSGSEIPVFDLEACDVRLTPWTPEGGFEPRVFGTGDGVPFAVDRDRTVGNAVMPIQARTAFKRLMGLQ